MYVEVLLEGSVEISDVLILLLLHQDFEQRDLLLYGEWLSALFANICRWNESTVFIKKNLVSVTNGCELVMAVPFYLLILLSYC